MKRALWAAAVLAAVACAPRNPAPPPPPRLTVEQITRLVPEDEKDRRGWAEDVLAAFENNGLWPDAPSVCAVLAVIEQESGFDPNPAVPGLAKIVRAELEEKVERLGLLGKPALNELLGGKAPGAKLTFAERLERVRTERELDVVFRELLAHYRAGFPNTYQVLNLANVLFGKGDLEEMNPITTAGSMQVSVRFAQELAEKQDRETCCVRDELYTRAGGVHYGTARLLGFAAEYETPLYRFADYNAGFYASRNAAFQAQLAELGKTKLALDGDLLAYDERGEPAKVDGKTLQAMLAFGAANGLSEWRIRRDLRREKERDFEETESWRTLKRVFEERTGNKPVYAQLPDVTLVSPKLRKGRTTAWFAKSVEARYQRCLKRHEAPAVAPKK